MKIYEYTFTPRLVREGGPVAPLSSPHVVCEYMQNAFDSHPEQESFWVIPVNRRKFPKGRQMVTLGTQTAAMASPALVLRSVLLANGTGFVCVHNHPSGDPAPSSADINLTRYMREAARFTDLEFVDHVIMGDPSIAGCGKEYFSFREAGLL